MKNELLYLGHCCKYRDHGNGVFSEGEDLPSTSNLAQATGNF